MFLPLTGNMIDVPDPETAAAAPAATPDVKMVPVPVLAICRPPRFPAMAIVPALQHRVKQRVASVPTQFTTFEVEKPEVSS